jgi:hypothetical protein
MATYRRLTYKPDPYPVNTPCLVCGGEIAENSTVWLWMKETPTDPASTNPTPALPPSQNPIVYSHFNCGTKSGNRHEAAD